MKNESKEEKAYRIVKELVFRLTVFDYEHHTVPGSFPFFSPGFVQCSKPRYNGKVIRGRIIKITEAYPNVNFISIFL